MHILVTDATGALGRLVAGQLIAAGHTVTGIAELPHPAWTATSNSFARRCATGCCAS